MEFSDGTRLFVDHTHDGVEPSITGVMLVSSAGITFIHGKLQSAQERCGRQIATLPVNHECRLWAARWLVRALPESAAALRLFPP